MKTIFLVWDDQQQKHLITGATDGTTVWSVGDGNGLPAELWQKGRELVRLALAEDYTLVTRGDRFEHGEFAVVVEGERRR